LSEKGRTHLDLFSGIGGFALASKWAGFQTIGFSEIDPYSCRVLAKNFPGIPNLGDIKNINGKDFKNPALITGGFPCQPYSNGGLRRGSQDDRAIWPEMARVISEARPSWIIAENVLGLISLELDSVLDDLENLDYSTDAIIVPACSVDAPHRRDRIWVFAYSMRNIKPRAQSCRGEIGRVGGVCKSVPWNKPWETALREFRGVDDGLSYRVDRIDSIRNAIVPQLAFEFMTMINQIDES